MVLSWNKHYVIAMKNKSKEHPIVPTPIQPIEEPSCLVFKSTVDEKTGKRTVEMGLSNESKPSGSNFEELCAYRKKLEKSLQYTTGSTNFETAIKILEKQVVHVHNDGGQAIVAQNLSKNDASGGL
ncbi:MAG TPA: hypothetical protein VGO47_10635 [Chlamydiales bacterium]|jgi:hypothetical protein|nr:hypothetical protein [Chlamydiales bacterium]